MLNKWIKTTVVVLALGVGACSSSSGTKSDGGAGSGGSTGGSGGRGGGTGGSAGTDGGGPMSIEECAALSTPQAINDCIINLPTATTVTGQSVTFTGAVDYNTCKMQ